MVRANATWLAAWSTRRTRSTEWTGSCEMRLREVYPGVDHESVAAIAPWTVQPGEPIETCPPATEEEIAALRAVDPAAAARPSPLVHGLLSPPGAAASST